MTIASIVLVSAVSMLFVHAETCALIALLSLMFPVFFFGYVIASGRRFGRVRRGVQKYDAAEDDHVTQIHIVSTAILVGVVAIELAVRKSGGLWGDPWFLTLHLSLVALAATIFYFARIRYTGKIDRRRHRILVYAFMLAYIAAFTTGTVLINERFPLT